MPIKYYSTYNVTSNECIAGNVYGYLKEVIQVIKEWYKGSVSLR